MKLTKQELSAAMSAHAAGELGRGGYFRRDDGRMCLYQCAHGNHYGHARVTVSVYEAFDRKYQPTWTPDQFLAWMEKVGVA